MFQEDISQVAGVLAGQPKTLGCPADNVRNWPSRLLYWDGMNYNDGFRKKRRWFSWNLILYYLAGSYDVSTNLVTVCSYIACSMQGVHRGYLEISSVVSLYQHPTEVFESEASLKIHLHLNAEGLIMSYVMSWIKILRGKIYSFVEIQM